MNRTGPFAINTDVCLTGWGHLIGVLKLIVSPLLDNRNNTSMFWK